MTGELMQSRPIEASIGLRLKRALIGVATARPGEILVAPSALGLALGAAPGLVIGLASIYGGAWAAGGLAPTSSAAAVTLALATAFFVGASLVARRWLQLRVVRPLRELGEAGAARSPADLPRELAAVRNRLSTGDTPERDRLTGLLSRPALHELAGAAFDEARAAGGRLTLAVIDLERLRDINVHYNYGVGDEVLRQLSRRLAVVCPAGTLVARIGGDRFAALIREAGDELEPARWPAALLRALGRQLCVDGCELQVNLSIGSAVFPDHGSTFPQLLRAADLAVENARRQEGRRWAQFDPRQNQAAAFQRALEKDLRKALETSALTLHYQPQVVLGSGRVVGVEALLRWQHPERGMIPPQTFIPVAEASGLIRPLGAWVLAEAARAGRRWREMGHDIGVSVNVSAAQLRRQDLVSLVEQVLRQTGLPPAALELELTESMFVDPTQVAMHRAIQGISAMGVRLAIDDFGTGYSSLGYLKRLPVDKIKIDKSFVRELGRDETDAAIVRSIIGLARVFGKRVLAEGVEDARQAHFLKGEGCDEAQGFYFSRPIPEAACTTFLQRHAPQPAAAPAAMAG